MTVVRTISEDQLHNLPKGAGASAPVQHLGGGCPVDQMQPVSVLVQSPAWHGDPAGHCWHPFNTASQHDWTGPCIYRTRTPHPGHPMLRARRVAANLDAPIKTEPLELIARDFERLVDAIENYLARA